MKQIDRLTKEECRNLALLVPGDHEHLIGLMRRSRSTRRRCQLTLTAIIFESAKDLAGADWQRAGKKDNDIRRSLGLETAYIDG